MRVCTAGNAYLKELGVGLPLVAKEWLAKFDCDPDLLFEDCLLHIG